MTLDQAIDRYTNNAEYERIHGSLQGCLDFKQLAEWLKDYKRLLEQQPTTTTNNNEPITVIYPTIVCDDAVSRDAVIEWLENATYEDICEAVGTNLDFLPPVMQKSGKWIKRTDRLPEDKTYVLTTIKVPNRVAHARSGWYECGFFHNDNGDTWRATDMEVKAWMPLPEPYEPQESEDKG
jgi:hypothetical protein